MAAPLHDPPGRRGGRPLRGELPMLYPGRLRHVETVVATSEDRRAILYDTASRRGRSAGGEWPGWTRRQLRRGQDLQASDRHLAVRHRTLIAEAAGGSLVCFPAAPPILLSHGLDRQPGYTLGGARPHGPAGPLRHRHPAAPDGAEQLRSLFNASPGSSGLGVLYLLSAGIHGGAAGNARYTTAIRFAAGPHHLHQSLAHGNCRHGDGGPARGHPLGISTSSGSSGRAGRHSPPRVPRRWPPAGSRPAAPAGDGGDVLRVPPPLRRGAVVDPGGGDQRHPGRQRTRQAPPFDDFLPNGLLDPAADGRAALRGAAPKACDRLQRRERAADMVEPQAGTRPRLDRPPAHQPPAWTPDIFRREPFFLEETWLGRRLEGHARGPSRPRLGERALDLLSDMANWGQQKYMPRRGGRLQDRPHPRFPGT